MKISLTHVECFICNLMELLMLQYENVKKRNIL